MDDGAKRPDAAKAQAKEILRLERRVRQLGRVAKNSEEIARQNQAAYRRTVADLEALTSDLTEATARAESAVIAKDTFLATMSHEIRTPMNGVIGCIELIDRGTMGSEQQEVVDTLQSSANALLLLLNDVLDYAKLESGRTKLESVPFRMDHLLDEVAALHTPAAVARGVEVSVEWDGALTGDVLGDPYRLRQVIHNLASNAVKFTSEGSVTMSAAIIDESKRVRIAVKDTGIGMSVDVLESIFQPFLQADDSTTRRFGGTGLGLAICNSLVEAMGGKIDVQSVTGSGSTFSFDIDLHFAGPASHDFAPTQPAAPASPNQLNDLRVLLVDDTPVNLLVAEKMLKRLGCSVMTAKGGSEAIDLWAKHEWDAILMDCSMPDVDGYEATRRIRAAESPGSHLPIVALTAFAMPGDNDRSFAAGMDHHLTKPLTMEALRKTLLACLGSR